MGAVGRVTDLPLTVGTPVEVWNSFESSFTGGFEVSGVDDGYRVRRLSDGVELPVRFRPDDVRPNHAS